MADQSHVPGIAPPSPRDEEIRVAVAELVDNYAWAEARTLLNARLREMAQTRRTHIETVFLAWCEIPREDRPGFFEYAHSRRVPALKQG